MKFYKDSDVETEVIWYRCLPEAKAYRGQKLFSSLNNENGEKKDGPGEVPGAPRPWYNSAPPALFRGDKTCGEERIIQEGAVAGDEPLELGPDGFPLCCNYGPAGYVWNGSAVQGPGSGFNDSPGGFTWNNQAVIIAGGGIRGTGGYIWGGRGVAGHIDIFAEGGFVWNGEALILDHSGIIGKGGFVWNGQGIAGRTPDIISEGGFVWNGEALQQEGSGLVGKGGYVWNGSFYKNDPLIGSGGYVWNGNADQGSPANIVGSGGYVWNGQAEFS